jgi:hypothetical protein
MQAQILHPGQQKLCMTKEHANQTRMILARYDKLEREINVMDAILCILVEQGSCRVSFQGDGDLAATAILGSGENPNLLRTLYSAMAEEKGRLERDCEKLAITL